MKVVIVGGGVIGLSLAWELATRGQLVTVVEKERLGRQASWAGAGILPPSNAATAVHPLEHLEALSDELHPIWARRLVDETGIDNGFQNCGGLYIARTFGEKASLAGRVGEWADRGIEFRELDRRALARQFPNLAPALLDDASAWWSPDETQICNPHHVQALTAACRRSGVTLLENCGDAELTIGADQIQCVRTANGDQTIGADVFCIAAGPWSGQIAQRLSNSASADSLLADELPMVPVRGQMLMYKLKSRPLESVVNEGTRYLVPRADGHVLFGATIEEVGFDTATTQSGIDDLKKHAESILPDLTDDTLVKTWAGLRPGTFDGFPYIGAMPQVSNLFVAAGHFKAGLHLSPGTAVVVADLIEGYSPAINLRPFSPARARVTG